MPSASTTSACLHAPAAPCRLPPLMIEAVLAMLDELGVEPTAILNDEFSA